MKLTDVDLRDVAFVMNNTRWGIRFLHMASGNVYSQDVPGTGHSRTEQVRFVGTWRWDGEAGKLMFTGAGGEAGGKVASTLWHEVIDVRTLEAYQAYIAKEIVG